MCSVVLVKKNSVRKERTRCDECVELEDSEELNPRNMQQNTVKGLRCVGEGRNYDDAESIRCEISIMFLFDERRDPILDGPRKAVLRDVGDGKKVDVKGKGVDRT